MNVCCVFCDEFVAYLGFTCLVNCSFALCKQISEHRDEEHVLNLTISFEKDKERERTARSRCVSMPCQLCLSIYSPDLMWTHPCRKPLGCRCSACTHHTRVSSWSSSPWRRGSLLWQAANTHRSWIWSFSTNKWIEIINVTAQRRSKMGQIETLEHNSH